jgi:hypothetical protein
MTRLRIILDQLVRIAALALGTCGAGASIADDAVLLTSTAPGYAPGMVVSASDTLSLPEGSSATLLFQSGETLRLRGPFKGLLAPLRDAGSTASLVRLVDAFRAQGVDAAVIGGTRATGLGRVRVAIDDVQVDPRRSGTYCLQPSTSVWIGRPDQEHGQYSLRRGRSTKPIAWPPGAARIEWPPNVSIDDGDRYEILTDGVSRVTVTFRLMPAEAASDAASVAQGILRGCQEQFSESLRRLAQAAGPPELWLTSDRGQHPVYRTGEPIALTVKSNADGYLYCIASRENGAVTPIFPAGAVSGARVHAPMAVSMPGPRRHAELIAGPSGRQEVRCWLADRDISPELPHAMLDAAMTPLPDSLARDVEAIFAGITGSQMARTSMAIRVE